MSQRRVVITGLGVISPIGTGWEQFWQSLCTQRKGLRTIKAFDVSKFACHVGGEVDDFKINQHIPRSYRKAAKLMARDIAMAVIAADLAVRDSGLVTKAIDPDNPKVDPTRLATHLGAGLIDMDLDELAAAVNESTDEQGLFSYKLWGKHGLTHLTPIWLLKFLPNMLACHIGIIHDAQGPSNTVLCGEISAHQAITEAFHTITDGSADICISGAAKDKIAPLGCIRMELLGRLNTTSNDSPETAVRPFDKRRAGCVPAESSGIFILEDLEHAQKRGAKIYAELVGSSATRKAKSTHQLVPHPEGIARAIKEALERAKCQPQDIDLVIPHGIGGIEEDLAEAQGIRLGLGQEKGSTVPVLPIQGSVGNSIDAAGALDLIAGILAISQKQIPAAVNCEQPCPECGLNIVQENVNNAELDTVLVSGHTIGGQSAAVILKRFA